MDKGLLEPAEDNVDNKTTSTLPAGTPGAAWGWAGRAPRRPKEGLSWKEPKTLPRLESAAASLKRMQGLCTKSWPAN